MNNNPWVNAWRDEPDDAVLKAIVERRAIAVDAKAKKPHELVELFAGAAEEIFLCDEQSLRILRQFLEIGRSHASRNYPSMAQFELRVQSRAPWAVVTEAAFAVIGGAGVGKSALANAAARLLASRRSEINGENLAGIPLTPMWHAKVRDARSIGDILEQLLNSDAAMLGGACAIEAAASNEKESKRVVTSLRNRIRTRSYRDGVVTILVDELQFGARGTASAWITSLLLQLLGFGPLLFFVMNFSLAHKLWDRPPEDKRRLLTNVIEVRPFATVDEDWIRFLNELCLILPNAWDFDCKAKARDILRFTFGIRDNAVAILKFALIIARTEQPNGKVTSAHIDQAYRCEAYAARREDVEKLLGSRESLKKRSDLYSPFRARAATGSASGTPQVTNEGSTPGAQPMPILQSTVVVAENAIRERDVRVLDAMHVEQMQPEQRKRVERENRAARQATPSAKVVPIRSRKAADGLDDVIGAAADLVSTR